MPEAPVPRPTLLLTAASLLLSSCTSDNPSPSTILRDSADVLIAENHSDASTDEWQLQLPPVLEIGRADGDEDGPDLFGYISQAIRLSNGDIAVADGLAREIRIFDENGSHRITFGRPGEGPGEFTNLWSIAELAGDTIAAIDNLNGRASLFTSAGAFVRSFPIPRLPGGSAPNVAGWLEDGTLLIQTNSRACDPGTRATNPRTSCTRSTVTARSSRRSASFAGSRLGRNGLGLGFGSRARFAVGGTLAWYGHPSDFELVGP